MPHIHDEEVFSFAHPLYGRIVYDRLEGKYYDRHTDLYLSIEEWERLKNG